MQYFSVMLVRVRMIMTAAIAVIVVIVVVVMATAAAIVGMIMRVIGLGEYALYLYGGVIVHMQALAAIIANFKRVEVTQFAFAATYAFSIVQNAIFFLRFFF